MNKNLNELEIHDDTKLFFVGTTTQYYDIIQKKFLDHKQLDKICVESSMFGTSTYGYALAYAKQYATKQYHGCIVAFEVKPGTRFFNLRDKDEYDQLGLPNSIANIFFDAEPYFAINTQVPNTQAFVVPIEFKIAYQILTQLSPTSAMTLVDKIQTFKAHKLDLNNNI